MANFRKIPVIVVFLMIFSLVSLSQAFAAENGANYEKGDTVQLTPEQKAELTKLNKEILTLKKELITKYVKYGVISEEKGKKIISRLEKRCKNLEEEGFTLPKGKLKARGIQ